MLNEDKYIKEYSQMLNDLNEDKGNVDSDTFMVEIKKEYLKLFPKAWIAVNVGGLGKKSMFIDFGVQPKNKIENNIEHNDVGHHKLVIFNAVDENSVMNDKLDLHNVIGGSISIKPPEGSHLAFGTAKVGWRNKKGTPEQALKHLINYFKKLKKVVDSNKDNIIGDLK